MGGVPLTAGDWVIEIYESTVPLHNHGSPYLGWSNSTTLMTVEEIY